MPLVLQLCINNQLKIKSKNLLISISQMLVWAVIRFYRGQRPLTRLTLPIQGSWPCLHLRNQKSYIQRKIQTLILINMNTRQM